MRPNPFTELHSFCIKSANRFHSEALAPALAGLQALAKANGIKLSFYVARKLENDDFFQHIFSFDKSSDPAKCLAFMDKVAANVFAAPGNMPEVSHMKEMPPDIIEAATGTMLATYEATYLVNKEGETRQMEYNDLTHTVGGSPNRTVH